MSNNRLILVFLFLFLPLCCRENSTNPDDLNLHYTIINSLNGDLYSVTDLGQKKVLSHSASYYPRYSPDKKLIAFSYSDAAGQWIVTIPSVGGERNKIALISSVGDDGYVTFEWSPDGSKIALNKYKGEFVTSDIYIYDLNGNQISKLTDSGYNYAPIWPSNGQKIAYRTGLGINIRISMSNIDGTNNVDLSKYYGRMVVSVNWAPNNSNIALVINDTTSKINEIYLTSSMESNNSLEQITFDGNNGGTIRWSNDSKKLLFASWVPNVVTTNNMNLLNTENMNITNITKNGNTFPYYFWSQDSKKIAYVKKSSNSDKYYVHIINVDGSGDIDTQVEFGEFFDWKMD